MIRREMKYIRPARVVSKNFYVRLYYNVRLILDGKKQKTLINRLLRHSQTTMRRAFLLAVFFNEKVSPFLRFVFLRSKKQKNLFSCAYFKLLSPKKRVIISQEI